MKRTSSAGPSMSVSSTPQVYPRFQSAGLYCYLTTLSYTSFAGSVEDKIIVGPTEYVNNWPSLKETGFQTIDCILPRQDDKQLMYVFCGVQYATIRVVPGKLILHRRVDVQIQYSLSIRHKR